MDQLGKRSSGVHVFSIFGTNLAYDSAGGALLEVDDAAKAVIEHIESHAAPSLNTALLELAGDSSQKGNLSAKAEFSPREIEEAWNEVAELTGSLLWTDDPGVTRSRDLAGGPEGFINVPVKAMCLNIAHDCNLACKYCFAAQGRFGGKPEIMSKDVARASVDFLVRSSGNRRFLDLDFFGGEPLLAFPVVKDTVEYAREEGRKHGKEFRFTLTTNCTLMTDEIAAYLADEGISLILSIDGRPEVHDRMRVFRGGQPSYDVALRNAKKAVEARGGKDYWVRGTFTRYNLDFDEDAKYLYEEGFRYISLEPAVGEGEWSINESHLEDLEKSYANLVRFWSERYRQKDPFHFYHFNLGLKKGMCIERRETGCGAGYEYVSVTPSGQVYACHQLIGKDEYKLGDVYHGISNHDIPKLFYVARVPNKLECAKCWARYLCGGGCHASALMSTGDIMKPDPLTCEMLKKRMEYALYVEYVSLSPLRESHRG